MSSAAIRRLLHASSAIVLLLAHFGSIGWLRYCMAAAAATAIVLDVLRMSRPTFGQFITDLVPVFRVSEAHRLSGATWLCIGYAVSAWFPLQAASAGILTGAFADPAASLVGSLVTSDRGNKTWAGSTAAAVVAVAVLAAVGVSFLTVLYGAVAAMVLERWPGPFNDNLTVPTGVTLVVWLQI